MAARESYLPGTSTLVQDFNLNVRPEPVIRNKRIVILGTAEDGPMYEPVGITKPEDAEFVWGRFGAGSLVRGIFESWNVQTGYPTVVGVRIGNGTKAALSIEESTGSSTNAPQAISTTALKLEAIYPGQRYNNVTVAYDENRNVAIYNPKTGLTSTFSVDTERPNNVNADVHNVDELVTAINADSNLSSIVTASYTPLQADYEIAISGLSNGVSQTSLKVILSLQDILSSHYVVNNGYIIPDPVGTGVTAANNIVQFQNIESVSVSQWEDLGNKSKVNTYLKLSPLDGKHVSYWDTIQCFYDYDDDNKYMHDPSGTVSSEYIHNLKYEFADGGNGEGGPTASGGVGLSGYFRIATPLCLDDSEEVSNSGIASGYIQSLLGSTYSKFKTNWAQATCQGIESRDVGGYQARPSGLIKVYVSTDSDINGYWQELPYSTSTGVFLSSYDGTYAKFGIGSTFSAPTLPVSGVMRNLLDASGNILPDRFIRVSANTIKGFLTEKESLPELEDAGTATLQTYFVRGQEILFNKAPAFDMIVNYGTRIAYEPGSTVTISDINQGYLTFSASGLLPGPGGAALSDTKLSYLRLRYTYMPNFPNITSAAKSLTGGTNGTALNNAQLYDQLDSALSKLRNYGANIWVPMGANIDAVAEKFNQITGLKEEVPVGFHTLFGDFLEDLSINNIQPHAILGVTPAATISQVNKDEWVDKLTITDLNDPNRGANIMSLIQNRMLAVCAFEPVFLNIGRGRPYTANGQAAYAGLLASIPYNISPMNKTIRGIQSLRFTLSESQYERLNAMRYVTMMQEQGRNPTIIEDVTAAPYGSDYKNWVISSIVNEACDRVRAVAKEFIGMPNSVEVRTSLEQQVSNVLNTMAGLRASDFSLNSTADQQVLGIIDIDLLLVPIFTIRRIRTTVKVRKQLPTT